MPEPNARDANLPAGPEALERSRAGSFMVRAGTFLFRFRNALFPAAALLFLSPGSRVWHSPGWPLFLGAAVALAGQLVRIVTIGLEYIVRGGRHGRVYANGLVTTGVYAACRNPMYVGNLLIVAGLAIAANNWLALLIVPALTAFTYAAIVAAEENYLRARFGSAYEAYCRQVPRWRLQLAGLAGLVSGSRFHWRRVIVKEFGTPAGWIAILCLVGLFNTRRHHPGSPAELVLVATLALVAVLWFGARTMKKRRWLVAD